MIGNDIIDIKLFQQETNWERPNFLQKIYTEKERSQILQSDAPEILVAIFWAMKEACYKAHQRKFSLPRKYNPSAYECVLNDIKLKDAFFGNVKISEHYYSAEIVKTENYIHSVVKDPQIKFLQKIYEEEVNIKTEIIAHYSDFQKLPASEIIIQKDENFIPHLFYKGINKSIPFSISHHGKFSAFVLALMNS